MRNDWRARKDKIVAARAMQSHIELCGIGSFFSRGVEIEGMEKIPWRGRTLYRLRCRADFGKGPHDYNVPEYVLWHLIDLRSFRCAYHSN